MSVICRLQVLAHYQAEDLRPFKVLGVTLTREILTLMVGFFGTAIATLVTGVMAKNSMGDVKAVMMCHPTLLDFLRLAEPENPLMPSEADAQQLL